MPARSGAGKLFDDRRRRSGAECDLDQGVTHLGTLPEAASVPDDDADLLVARPRHAEAFRHRTNAAADLCDGNTVT